MSLYSYIKAFLTIFLMSLNGCTSTSTLDLHLSSNEIDTEFIVNGNLIGKSQRVKTQIENGLDVSHKIVSRLNGYCEKEDVINPPYMQKTVVVEFTYKEGDECIPCEEPCRLKYGKYHALVIGNNTYIKDERITLLDTPKNDAQVISEILKEKYGFTVKLIKDATYNDIITAINNYKNGSIDEQGNIIQQQLTKSDNLLIYFAGHGIFKELDNKELEGYWLPIDAEMKNQKNWISNRYLSKEIKEILSKHVLIIADSCYSGLLTRNIIDRNDSLYKYIGRKDYYDRLWYLSSRRSRMAFSSGGNEIVYDGGCEEGHHSIFACSLIKTLRNNNNSILDATLLFIEVRNELIKGNGQIPEYGNIREAGHNGGDFLFVDKEIL